jgi:hypothetical protein
MSAKLSEHLADSPIRFIAPSIGIPILSADGRTLTRGPRINVPEVVGYKTSVPLDDMDQVDRWASTGWIDLRPSNMADWMSRVAKMVDARIELRDEGSAAATTVSYLPAHFEIGEVVAWIFNNEMAGYRIK